MSEARSVGVGGQPSPVIRGSFRWTAPEGDACSVEDDRTPANSWTLRGALPGSLPVPFHYRLLVGYYPTPSFFKSGKERS